MAQPLGAAWVGLFSGGGFSFIDGVFIHKKERWPKGPAAGPKAQTRLRAPINGAHLNFTLFVEKGAFSLISIILLISLILLIFLLILINSSKFTLFAKKCKNGDFYNLEGKILHENGPFSSYGL